LGVRGEEAMLFQWVKGPPGEVLPPEATGAVVEVSLGTLENGHGYAWISVMTTKP
jgi:hypothetical protein